MKKGIKASDVVKQVAAVVGGKGGGKPHLATAGGKDGNKLSDALARALELGSHALLSPKQCTSGERRRAFLTSVRQTSETDPRFPSGKWVGFFLDKRLPGRHQMEILLTFAGGRLSGEGRDRVGKFTFEGSYDVADGKCRWVKRYVGKHTVRTPGSTRARASGARGNSASRADVHRRVPHLAGGHGRPDAAAAGRGGRRAGRARGAPSASRSWCPGRKSVRFTAESPRPSVRGLLPGDYRRVTFAFCDGPPSPPHPPPPAPAGHDP